MSGAAKESKWSDEAHAALCGALTNALVEAGSGPAKYKDSIMEFMASKNQVFTWEGIRQHLQKLRRKEGGAAAANANGGDDGPAPDTPKRKRAPAGKKAGGAAAKKKGGKAAPKQEDDSEEDVKSSPKKVKVEKEVQSPLNDDEDVLPPFAEF